MQRTPKGRRPRRRVPDTLSEAVSLLAESSSGIYISFPFCRQKCTYCNFASGVFSDALRREYLRTLIEEIRATPPPAPPRTLYLGGGTPSLLERDEIEPLLESLGRPPWDEATLEAAPGDITPEKARLWADLGVDRVSLGVQSFDRKVASRSGRRHDAETVAREIAVLREAGIARVNVDLIAGLAFETRETWRGSLDWVERLDVEHVSLYMLEVDDESRLGEELRAGGSRYGAAETPSEELTVELYESGVDRLAAMGIDRYEISNFARPGAESLHNLRYWTLQPYVGYGADAHSFDGGRRWANEREPAAYTARTAGSPREYEAIEGRRRLEDRLLTGLRLREGVVLAHEDLREIEEPLLEVEAEGWIERPAPDRLRLTRSGILFSNEVFGRLLFPEPVA